MLSKWFHKSNKNTTTTTTTNEIKSSRNAFFNFHRDYREERKKRGNCEPVNVTAAMAGKEWKRMSKFKRLKYILEARNVEYTYLTRVREANHVLNSLRNAIKSENEIDLIELQRTAMYMDRLKCSLNLEEFILTTAECEK